jgi:hypothetical protein
MEGNQTIDERLLNVVMELGLSINPEPFSLKKNWKSSFKEN